MLISKPFTQKVWPPQMVDHLVAKASVPHGKKALLQWQQPFIDNRMRHEMQFPGKDTMAT
jgi:hypothetical protein